LADKSEERTLPQHNWAILTVAGNDDVTCEREDCVAGDDEDSGDASKALVRRDPESVIF
jgi:hypothetical protein